MLPAPGGGCVAVSALCGAGSGRTRLLPLDWDLQGPASPGGHTSPYSAQPLPMLTVLQASRSQDWCSLLSPHTGISALSQGSRFWGLGPGTG